MLTDPPSLRPPFDPELSAVLAEDVPETLTPDMIESTRSAFPAQIDELLARHVDVSHREETVPGYDGAELSVSIFARKSQTDTRPAFFYIHGGGMVLGDRFIGAELMLDWVDQFDGVCVSVEHRLAPEFPDPYPLEDCYSALVWTAGHAAELGFDAGRLVIAGVSSGGGLAAGTALLARDRNGPPLAGQVLMSPMLDDRNDTVSSHQFDGIGVWDRRSNDTGWDALLGPRRRSEDVNIYAAPARATDLSRLPPAHIDVGSAEVFRDEAVAYASTIWASGGVAELHVWPGGYHSFDLVAPHAVLSRATRATRTAWLERLLSPLAD
jgi:acetyl esterase/lipase